MKYCNLNCKYLHTSIIERCGEGIGYEYRCMNQKGMPKVTIDTYCPYDEISETTQETNIEIKELKQELEVYEKALAAACDILADVTDSNSDSEGWKDWLLQKARKE